MLRTFEAARTPLNHTASKEGILSTTHPNRPLMKFFVFLAMFLLANVLKVGAQVTLFSQYDNLKIWVGGGLTPRPGGVGPFQYPPENTLALTSHIYKAHLKVPPEAIEGAFEPSPFFVINCWVYYTVDLPDLLPEPQIHGYRLKTLKGVTLGSWDGLMGNTNTQVGGLLSIPVFLKDLEDSELALEFLGAAGNVTARFKIEVEADCEACRDGACRSTGSVGSVDFRIPITNAQANGSFAGRPVSLKFFQEYNVNQGIGFLKAMVPIGQPGVTVTKDGSGNVQSVQVADVIARVDHLGTAATGSIPASGDPNRFRVRVSSDASDPDDSVFRTVIAESTDIGGSNPALVLTETLHGQTTVATYGNPSPGQWALETGSGLRRETHIESEDAGVRTKRVIIEERVDGTPPSFQAVSDVLETETQFAWGWGTTSVTVDPDGAAPLTTTTTYYAAGDDSSPDEDESGEAPAQVKTRTYPTGEVERHYYYETSGGDFAHLVRKAFAGTADAREILTTRSSEVALGSGLPVTITVVGKSAGGNLGRVD
ncbi:hypothetical protein [Luteolibacter sp. Populi]|uniref:hypothetical protein n=1 Tax=Luteolibacter sp. Populi TaxID=3230487 RepID=UPI0034672D36